MTGPKGANRRCEKKTRKLSGLSAYSYLKCIKVMLHGTIRNDDFWRNIALECWNNVVTI